MKLIGENMGRNSIKSVVQIEKLLADPWVVDLGELWDQVANRLFYSLFHLFISVNKCLITCWGLVVITS